MLNKIIIQGRISTDLNIETTASGATFCRFSVACQRNIKEKDGTRGTDFVPCVIFGKGADFLLQYFSKGSMALISGRLQVSNYEKDGQKLTYTNVVVDSVDFCEGKKETSAQVAPAPAAITPVAIAPNIATAPAPTVEEVQLPFDF